jgi:hypothetical protein
MAPPTTRQCATAQDVLALLIAGAQEEGKPLLAPHLFARTA